MKRKIISIMLIVVLLIYITFTLTPRTEALSIATVSQGKVAYGEDFYVILNLSAISFNKFNVEITNNEEMMTREATGNIQNLASSKVVTTFTVDKSQVGLDKMGIVFTAPEKETSIMFNIKITSLDVTQESLKNQITELERELFVLNSTFENINEGMKDITDTTSTVYQEALKTKKEAEDSITSKEKEKETLENKLNSFTEETATAQVMVQITKNAKEQSSMSFDKNQLEMNGDKEQMSKDGMDFEMTDKEKMMNKDMDMMKDKMNEMDKLNDEMNLKMNDLEVNLKQANDTISSLSKGTTYPGSSNNYLSQLSVTGYEFDNTFNKTINDYFISVDKSVTKVAVNAKAEESSAVVTIVGNTDLKDGQNKILINVTSEDGSIRTYRIYVTR